MKNHRLSNQRTLQERLYAIWKRKKIEFNLTQKEAADLLGWTAGALSQYLNGHTSLKPEAIIKLANFLEVDPCEIDPQMKHFIPQVATIKIKYHYGNSATKIKNEDQNWITSIPSAIDSFGILTDQDVYWRIEGKTFSIPANTVIQAIKQPKHVLVKNNALWIILLKGASVFEIMQTSDLPISKDISKQYLITGFML